MGDRGSTIRIFRVSEVSCRQWGSVCTTAYLPDKAALLVVRLWQLPGRQFAVPEHDHVRFQQAGKKRYERSRRAVWAVDDGH
jgi:hypothetical protein